jgi:hypothetical protein
MAKYTIRNRKKNIFTILLNIMFHAAMGRFQLELIYYFTYFSMSSHPIVVCFLPVGLSSLIRHFQEVLWVLKFLQERKTQLLDGTTVKNR